MQQIQAGESVLERGYGCLASLQHQILIRIFNGKLFPKKKRPRRKVWKYLLFTSLLLISHTGN